MRERIGKSNLNHGLLFEKSNCAMREIITEPNHDFL
jgi:hypothetical protein